MSGMFRKIKNEVSRMLTESEQGDLESQKQALETIRGHRNGWEAVLLTPNVKITQAIIGAAIEADAYNCMVQIYRVLQSSNPNAYYREQLPKVVKFLKRNLSRWPIPAPCEILKAIIEHEGEAGLTDIPPEVMTQLVETSALPVISAFAHNGIPVPEELMALCVNKDPRVLLKMIDTRQQFDPNLLIIGLIKMPAMYVLIKKRAQRGDYELPDVVQTFIARHQRAFDEIVSQYRTASGNTEV